MRKIYHYEIILNDGNIIKKPLVYKYNSTPNVELHILSNKARIILEQHVLHQPEEFLTSRDYLRTDAVKKVMLLHLVKYGKILDILKVDILVNSEVFHVYDQKKRNQALIFSMARGKLDYSLPQCWQDPSIFCTILSMTKSKYDGRMNALIALLIGKTKEYYCEKAMYLWISMNGFYNYFSDQVKKTQPHGTKELDKEWQRHKLFCSIMNLPKWQQRVENGDKDIVCKKALSILQHLDETPEILYEQLSSNQECDFSKKIGTLLGEYNAIGSPMTFLVMWLPYQIRCNYFHANQAVPMFLYADEPLLKSLKYTNYFVERFIEEHLWEWMMSSELSEAQKEKLAMLHKENR